MTGATPRQPERSGHAAFTERLSDPEPGSGSRATTGERATTEEKALPRILYIAGIPRSGTTVLGCLLGSIPDAIYVGELENFWRRFADNELCSCGQPLPNCPFWSVVVRKAFGQVTRERAQELNSLEQAVVGRQWLLALALTQWPATKSQRIGVILRERACLYGAIGEVANATCVVDSGKDVRYGRIVARLGDADFSTIHIVRDPRGVAFSWQKRVRSDSAPRDIPRRSAMKSALAWARQNLLIQFLSQRPGDSYVRVRYEDLVQQPADIRGTIAEATSVPAGHGSPPAAAAPGEGEHHWVSGNPGVRKRLGEGLQLILDEEWREGMPRGQRWLVACACSVMMVVYGYPLGSSPPRTGHAKESQISGQIRRG